MQGTILHCHQKTQLEPILGNREKPPPAKSAGNTDSAGLYSQGGVACAHSPPLVKVDQEHHVISETGQSVGRGHGDDEGKDIINESVKSLQSQTKQ